MLGWQEATGNYKYRKRIVGQMCVWTVRRILGLLYPWLCPYRRTLVCPHGVTVEVLKDVHIFERSIGSFRGDVHALSPVFFLCQYFLLKTSLSKTVCLDLLLYLMYGVYPWFSFLICSLYFNSVLSLFFFSY